MAEEPDARAGTGAPPAGYALSVAAGGCLSRGALSTQAGRPAAASPPAVRAVLSARSRITWWQRFSAPRRWLPDGTARSPAPERRASDGLAAALDRPHCMRAEEHLAGDLLVGQTLGRPALIPSVRCRSGSPILIWAGWHRCSAYAGCRARAAAAAPAVRPATPRCSRAWPSTGFAAPGGTPAGTRRPGFGNLYLGTGLTVDMGRPVTVTAVRVALGAARARTPRSASATSRPLALLAPVAPSAGPGGAVRLTLASPARDVPAPAPGWSGRQAGLSGSVMRLPPGAGNTVG